jgi:putative restriction endonuclease
MKLYVGITDFDWFSLHASKPIVEEVNFWRPSPTATFKALQPGELFLFKLHAPRNYIVGGGFLTRFLPLPLTLAWAAFGEANGARSLEEVRLRISKYRKQPIAINEDPYIGCILLNEPFFFDQDDWIPSPPDFKGPTQVGKSYDTDSGTGLMLKNEVAARLSAMTNPTLGNRQYRETASEAGVIPTGLPPRIQPTLGPATLAAIDPPRYGTATLVAPRLGQGSFRALVTDAYSYRCAVSRERTLPVLQAAHIRPYAEGGTHELSNGLLLRSDLHTLFDQHYLTIDPDKKTLIVSRRIREQFENGRDYYAMHNRDLAQPNDERALPSIQSLKYHFECFAALEANL